MEYFRQYFKNERLYKDPIEDISQLFDEFRVVRNRDGTVLCSWVNGAFRQLLESYLRDHKGEYMTFTFRLNMLTLDDPIEAPHVWDPELDEPANLAEQDWYLRLSFLTGTTLRKDPSKKAMQMQVVVKSPDYHKQMAMLDLPPVPLQLQPPRGTFKGQASHGRN